MINKNIVLFLVLLPLMPLYAQDSTVGELVREIGRMTLKIDSLQRQVIAPLYDSLHKMESNYQSDISDLKKQISSLEEDAISLHVRLQNLEDSIGVLNKNEIIVERDILLLQVDSLKDQNSALVRLVSQKDQQIVRERQLGVEKAMLEKEKGKRDVFLQIIQTYNRSFDDLVKSTGISIIERDLSILESNIELPVTLIHLQKYFNAELVLSERFSEHNVIAAQSQLEVLDQTEQIIKIADILRLYKLNTDALISTINKVIEIDRRFVANDDYSQQEKLKDILNEFAWYFRNYRFNFSDYPYLSEIVLEIMKQKQLDANTEIRHFIDKL